MEFEVDVPNLCTAAGDLGDIASVYPQAQSYVSSYLEYTGSRELVLGSIGEAMDSARATLTTVYSATGSIPSYLTGASRALRCIADDYKGIDKASRAKFDGMIDGTDVDESDYGLYAGSETRGVDQADLAAKLKTPAPDGGYDNVHGFLDSVRTAVGLGWILEPAKKFAEAWGDQRGAEAMFQWMEVIYNNWDSVEEAAQALQALAEFTESAAHEAAATGLWLSESWSGNAADACLSSLGAFGEVMEEHQEDLREGYSTLNVWALSMRICMDVLNDALDILIGDFVELATLDFDWGDILGDLLKKGLELVKAVIKKILATIGLVVVAIEAVFALGTLIGLLGAQFNDYDIDAPDGAPSMKQPDVAGP